MSPDRYGETLHINSRDVSLQFEQSSYFASVSTIFYITKCYIGPRNWTDTLERPKARKMDMRFGTWNIRSLYRPGSLKTVSEDGS
jgi:hypothetical protein